MFQSLALGKARVLKQYPPEREVRDTSRRHRRSTHSSNNLERHVTRLIRHWLAEDKVGSGEKVACNTCVGQTEVRSPLLTTMILFL